MRYFRNLVDSLFRNRRHFVPSERRPAPAKHRAIAFEYLEQRNVLSAATAVMLGQEFQLPSWLSEDQGKTQPLNFPILSLTPHPSQQKQPCHRQEDLSRRQERAWRAPKRRASALELRKKLNSARVTPPAMLCRTIIYLFSGSHVDFTHLTDPSTSSLHSGSNPASLFQESRQQISRIPMFCLGLVPSTRAHKHPHHSATSPGRRHTHLSQIRLG